MTEAAERLLSKWVVGGDLPRPPKGGWTVPRLIAYLETDIRAALERIALDLPGEDFRGVYTVLDAEAER